MAKKAKKKCYCKGDGPWTRALKKLLVKLDLRVVSDDGNGWKIRDRVSMMPVNFRSKYVDLANWFPSMSSTEEFAKRFFEETRGLNVYTVDDELIGKVPDAKDPCKMAILVDLQ